MKLFLCLCAVLLTSCLGAPDANSSKSKVVHSSATGSYYQLTCEENEHIMGMAIDTSEPYYYVVDKSGHAWSGNHGHGYSNMVGTQEFWFQAHKSIHVKKNGSNYSLAFEDSSEIACQGNNPTPRHHSNRVFRFDCQPNDLLQGFTLQFDTHRYYWVDKDGVAHSGFGSSYSNMVGLQKFWLKDDILMTMRGTNGWGHPDNTYTISADDSQQIQCTPWLDRSLPPESQRFQFACDDVADRLNGFSIDFGLLEYYWVDQSGHAWFGHLEAYSDMTGTQKFKLYKDGAYEFAMTGTREYGSSDNTYQLRLDDGESVDCRVQQ